MPANTNPVEEWTSTRYIKEVKARKWLGYLAEPKSFSVRRRGSQTVYCFQAPRKWTPEEMEWMQSKEVDDEVYVAEAKGNIRL